MAESPINKVKDKKLGSGNVTLEISVDGSKVPENLYILEVETVKEINKVPYAKIVLLDGDTREQTFPKSEEDMFKPGGEVEIKVSHNPEDLETIYKGLIVEHGIRHTQYGGSALTLLCKDEALKLKVGRKNTIFYEMTDSDIISQIVSDAGLSADVESTSVTHKKLIRYYSTDWDFIQARADANSLVTIINDGEISIKKPTVSEATDLLITYGNDLISMDLKLDATYQYSEVEANCWNYPDQAVDNAAGAKPTTNDQGDVDSDTLSGIIEPKELIQTTAPVTKDMLQAWADSVYQRGHLSRIRGTVKFIGAASAEVGKTVEMEALGSRFNGNGYVSKVRHSIKNAQWFTEIGFGLPAKTHLETYAQAQTLPAGGGLPAIHGLQHGVVKQIDGDPDGQFRVLVNIPVIDNLEGEGVWARMGQTYATSGAGMMCYPEIGDEVVLGFFDDDPTYPVILASLYSSAQAIAGAEGGGSGDHAVAHGPTDDNKMKGFSVQGGAMRLEFDDVDSVIKLLTPNNHILQISDSGDFILIEDPVNKNSILLDAAGITMETDIDITMKAKGNIIMEAQQNIETKSEMNTTMEAGVNFEIKGGAQLTEEAPIFEIKGSGMGTVDGGGMLTVKGGMVMIN